MAERYKFHATARGMKTPFQIKHLQDTTRQTTSILPEKLP
jgi:hypothetical protein